MESAIANNIFCFPCLSKTTPTDHFDIEQNELIFRLSGRVELHHAAALFNFIKGGLIQNAIHQLKYRKKPGIGLMLGNQFGIRLKGSALFKKPDLIIPIPCHYKRKRQRGYNQCEKFALGIAQVLKCSISEKYLRKNKEIVSQTTKSRSDRFDNVLRSFELRHSRELENKIVLLVDDVMTTGATIEAAYTLLKNIPGLTLQIGLIVLADG